MMDGDRKGYFMFVWMRKDMKYFFYNLKKKIEWMKFFKRMLIFFKLIYIKILRNCFCKNKEDKIFFLYMYFV